MATRAAQWAALVFAALQGGFLALFRKEGGPQGRVFSLFPSGEGGERVRLRAPRRRAHRHPLLTERLARRVGIHPLNNKSGRF